MLQDMTEHHTVTAFSALILALFFQICAIITNNRTNKKSLEVKKERDVYKEQAEYLIVLTIELTEKNARLMSELKNKP